MWIGQRFFLRNTATMPQKRALYALLIGIDTYPYPVPPLRGCVRDVRQFKSYLEEEFANRFELHIMLLCDAAALKNQVITQMEAHLGLAGAGDVALLYYSGHGAQERADSSLWPTEPAGLLEGLVCYDSIPPYGNEYQLLADKELRYLIHRVAHGTVPGSKPVPPHVVTIFDCCHSGSNTRDGGASERARYFSPMPPRPGDARLGVVLPVRQWDQFIFSTTIKEADIRDRLWQEVLPEGLHIQLAACRSDESAYETGGSGVFSQHLLEVLRRSEGNVSYYELRNRLYYFIKNQFQQSPQLYAGGGTEAFGIVYKGFLDGSSESRPIHGNVVYDASIGWTMDLGAVHGISAQTTGLRIVESGTDNPAYPVSIRSLFPSETLLVLDAATEAHLNPDKHLYQVYMDSLAILSVRVFIHGDGEKEEKWVEVYRRAVLAAHQKGIFLAEKWAYADYILSLTDGCAMISSATSPYQPLVLPSRGHTAVSIATTLDYLHHIARWLYVKNLGHQSACTLPMGAVAVQIGRVASDGGFWELDNTGGVFRMDFEKGAISGSSFGGRLYIAIQNTCPFPLYVSVLYLSNTFGIDGTLLSGKVVRLREADSVRVLDGAGVPLFYEKSAELLNGLERIYFFKLVFSRHEFTVDMLEQEALPEPGLHLKRPRGDFSSEKTVPEVSDEWGTRLIEIRIPHPNYKERNDVLPNSC